MHVQIWGDLLEKAGFTERYPDQMEDYWSFGATVQPAVRKATGQRVTAVASRWA
jgi:multiple sugar transport system substrate-binding protein